MTRKKALIATFVAIYSMTVGAWVGLALAGAEDDVFVAVILLIACCGALAVSEVVGRYDRTDQRREPGRV